MKRTCFLFLLFYFFTFLPSYAFSESKVVAVLPFENLHRKPHLEFVKNVVHEKLFTELNRKAGSVKREELKTSASDHNTLHPSPFTLNDYIVIGVSSLEDAKKLFKLSGGKVPTVVLQGEYFMIRDRLALNVSLLNPKDGSRIDGTGELVVYKGNRHPELQGQSNFQQSLYEDIQEPLNKLIASIQDLIEGKKKEDKK